MYSASSMIPFNRHFGPLVPGFHCYKPRSRHSFLPFIASICNSKPANWTVALLPSQKKPLKNLGVRWLNRKTVFLTVRRFPHFQIAQIVGVENFSAYSISTVHCWLPKDPWIFLSYTKFPQVFNGSKRRAPTSSTRQNNTNYVYLSQLTNKLLSQSFFYKLNKRVDYTPFSEC